MALPELLRDALREVLYGPDGLRGLFSGPGDGLLHTVHAFTLAQARTAPPGLPVPARQVLALRHTLELTVARLSDPAALLTDPTEPAGWTPADAGAWRAELMQLARAGQALYDALYSPLTPEGQREAAGAVLHAAREAAALRASLLVWQAQPSP
ncbi:hypothetical protein HNQ07_004466 [Deinococcus metalli]|uniref:Uncharacterized protein n=1 Tax=Deinococcus metalli TaxID=1141878 RepID=A0A7W8KLT7_9DEIO|nr:hypothetical protein [Deinococcus metalli]MBB5378959.1 hypothetical protein [Deinococcus metalli]GHF63018.1 hypothetical protein GCM10017781_43860 [Deinococcus metalli]